MNFESNEPMDAHLLQLERELFSLTPVETPRYLAVELETQVAVPVIPVARRTPASHQRIAVPFRWGRIVVPAAAAVVVVSVLNRQGNGYPPSAVGNSRNGQTSVAASKSANTAASLLRASRPMSSYVMMSEVSPLQNVNWSPNPNQYYVNPESHSSAQLVLPRRETMSVASFH